MRRNKSGQLNNQLKVVYTYGQNRTADLLLPEICPLSVRYNIEGKLIGNELMPFIAIRHSFPQNRIASDFGEITTTQFTVVDLGVKVILKIFNH